MIRIDRHALLEEILAAITDHPDLAGNLRRVFGVDSASGVRLESVAQRAERTGVGRSTLRRAIAEHRLACVRVGRAVRIPIDAEISSGSGNSVLDRAEARLGLVAVRPGRRR